VEEEDGAAANYFVAPAGGGTKLVLGKMAVTVVTPKAPLGAALLGKRVGDEVTVVLAGRARTVTIVSVD
jgi:Transcription elongation factor, GreA/GreB, C-term